jgi:O-antigen biosynthesis protein
VSTENSAHALVASLVGRNARVADIGCGPGNIARLLKEQSCTVVGVDASRDALASAAPYCERTVAADLDREELDGVLQGEIFDVVVFADVLEHLRDPGRTLRASKPLLREGGFVVASIPNVAHGAVRLSLLLGRFDYQPLGVLDATHLRWFTKRSVLRLFADAGFAIEALERTSLPVFSDSGLIPRLDGSDFPPPLAAAVEGADEGETLQFVVKARPDATNRTSASDAGEDQGLLRALRNSFSSIDPAMLQESEQRRRFVRDLEEKYARLDRSYRELEEHFVKDVDELRTHIRGMETSLFWRLRSAINRLLRRRS